ncbi:hypothetical protein BDE02_06G081400 [Populus trichocarpa]|nr:hypothetical protein BDE02_06G081400 [Populus trichocarpa]
MYKSLSETKILESTSSKEVRQHHLVVVHLHHLLFFYV